MKEKMKNIRLSQNMSQKEMADYFGVSRSCVSAWERGERFPSPYYINKYQELFELKKAYFSSKEGDVYYEVCGLIDMSVLNSRGAAKLYDCYVSLLEDEEYLKN